MKTSSLHLGISFLLAYAVFLVFFGWKFHPIMLHGVEVDGYVARAETFLAGGIPADPFRPLLYPLLSAFAAIPLGDAFAGAKWVSHASAVFLVAATYMAGRRHFGLAAAVAAAVFLALNQVFIRAGVQAATDMLFSALAVVSLVYALGIREQDGVRQVAILGFLFAMTYFTRYTAVALLPALCLALVWTPQLSVRTKVRRLAIFAAAALVFLLPHFLLVAHSFGDPFYNENWKNLAFKLYGDGDWSYFGRIPYDGMLSVVAADPLRFAQAALSELVEFLVKGLPQLAGNGHRALGLPLLLLFLVGAWAGLARRSRPLSILLVFVAVYTLMVSTIYLALSRLMLPILPVFYLFSAYGGLVVFRGLRRPHPVSPRVAVSVLVGLTALHASYLYPRLERFVQLHAEAELAAARELLRREGPDVRLISTYQNLKHHVDGGRVFFAHNAFNVEREDRSRYFEKLEREIRSTDAQYLIVGEKTLGNRPAHLLMNDNLPAYLQPVVVDSDVAVYRVRRSVLGSSSSVSEGDA